MNRLKQYFEKLKQWILYFVTNRLFFYENGKQSVTLSLLRYKIKRRSDTAKKYGLFREVELFYYRRSKLKGYEYITFTIVHYLRINIDLHRPIS